MVRHNLKVVFFLDFVERLYFIIITTFRNLDLPSSGKNGRTETLCPPFLALSTSMLKLSRSEASSTRGPNS
jgi:hypothetical protein